MYSLAVVLIFNVNFIGEVIFKKYICVFCISMRNVYVLDITSLMR